MNQITFFRVLIICNWLLQMSLFVLPISVFYTDPVVEKLMMLDGYGAIFGFESSAFYQAPLWGFFVASAGMIFFKNWARYLYLMMWLYGWFAVLVFGVRVSVPIQGFIGMAVGTLDGMVLYLAFMSALRLDFRGASEKPMK